MREPFPSPPLPASQKHPDSPLPARQQMAVSPSSPTQAFSRRKMRPQAADALDSPRSSIPGPRRRRPLLPVTYSCALTACSGCWRHRGRQQDSWMGSRQQARRASRQTASPLCSPSQPKAAAFMWAVTNHKGSPRPPRAHSHGVAWPWDVAFLSHSRVDFGFPVSHNRKRNRPEPRTGVAPG